MSTLTNIPRSELKILLILAAIQFLAFLDFELIMPMGAYIGPDLGVNASQLGELVSAYTLAGMVGGFAYSRVADRWEKRSTLSWLMAGLALGTLCCGLGHSYFQLIAARALAGLMAGPASANLFAIVSDVVPEQRRGKGIGIVMGGYTVASVLGIPISVYLANSLGWRLPFVGLSILAFIVIEAAHFILPKLEGHKPPAEEAAFSLTPLYHQSPALLAWFGVTVMMIGDFAFVPFLPTYLTANLGLAKGDLGLIYGAGGLTTLFTFMVAGRLVDRFGSFWVYALSSAGAIAVIYVFFFLAPSPATLAFAVCCMVFLFLFNAPRVLAGFTLFTKAVRPKQRGQFLSLQNVVQQGAVGFGSLLAAHLISGTPGGRIEGMSYLALQNWLAVLAGLFLIGYLERSLKSQKN